MINEKVTFQYKGSRNYVQGPDMFNMFLEQFSGNELTDIRFSVHGFVHQVSCLLYISKDKSDLDSVSDIKARCQVKVDGEVQYLGLSPMSDPPELEPGRYAYDENSLLQYCQVLDDRIILNGQSPFSFIETIVAMKKRLMESLFPEVEGKWVFTRIDLPISCDANTSLTIVFKHNMNFRILKSDILVDGEKVGDLYFSLVKS